MSALSRTDLQDLNRDQLVEIVLDLDRRMEDLEEFVEQEIDKAGKDRAKIRAERGDRLEDLDTEIRDTQDRLSREQSKLARRLSAVEDEVGVARADVLATAEGGEEGAHLTKLGRLVRHGPEAVSDNPGGTLYRARELVDNWNRWGAVIDDARGTERRLASKKHDLRTRLEDARDEDLDWRQVYRAMEWIDRESDANVRLVEGSQAEGKYVLVHRVEGDR